MRRIRVLVVDDAVVVRSLLTKLLAEDPQLEVVGAAASGRIALAILARQPVDVLLLDVEMPDLNGLETLSLCRRQFPAVAVMMFSSMTERGAQVTLDALSLGAVDYYPKPAQSGGVGAVAQLLRDGLIPKIKAVAARRLRDEPGAAPPAGTPAPAAPPAAVPVRPRGPLEVLAIGTSTGGPNALAALVPALPPRFPLPVLIVQHMPPIFTKLLAERLASKSQLAVFEARDGEPLSAGKVFIAPGNYHMVVTRADGTPRVQLHMGPPENSCRPAVDVLFRSVAEIFPGRALAVVLTGMGEDGARGCEAIHRSGGQVLAQDEASSVVWGMPRLVALSGCADRVVALDRMALEIVRRTTDSRER